MKGLPVSDRPPGPIYRARTVGVDPPRLVTSKNSLMCERGSAVLSAEWSRSSTVRYTWRHLQERWNMARDFLGNSQGEPLGKRLPSISMVETAEFDAAAECFCLVQSQPALVTHPCK